MLWTIIVQTTEDLAVFKKESFLTEELPIDLAVDLVTTDHKELTLVREVIS